MSAQKYTKPIAYTNNLPIFFVILRAITPKINHILLQFVLNPSNRFNRPQACFYFGQRSKVKGQRLFRAFRVFRAYRCFKVKSQRSKAFRDYCDFCVTSSISVYIRAIRVQSFRAFRVFSCYKGFVVKKHLCISVYICGQIRDFF